MTEEVAQIEEEVKTIDETSPDVSEEPPVELSKNQQRRLKMRVKWLEKRVVKRVEERQRKKEKRVALKEAGEFLPLKRKRGKKMADSKNKQRIVLDMSFDHLMSPKDQKRTVQQINWCYTANRHSEEPFQFHVTSFDGPSRKIYEGVEGNRNQDIFLHDKKLEELFAPEEIVYLSAESDNVLTQLDDSKVYVIGGLVDHNFHKGLCHKLAEDKKFSHARLPIDEYVHLKTRRVLTINQVYEILVHFSLNNDWEKAFLSIVPERKGMKKKDDGDPEGAIESETKAENLEEEVKVEPMDDKPEVSPKHEES